MIAKDHVEKPILLLEPPSIVIPVHITRRRRTNAEDVNKAMEGIKAAQADLQKATNHAERITELIFMATSGMSSIAKKYEKMRNMGYSKWRLKWIFAARRVYTKLHCEVHGFNRPMGSETKTESARSCYRR